MRIAHLFFLLLIAEIASAQSITFKSGEEFYIKTVRTDENEGINRREEYTFSFNVTGAEKDMYNLQCKLVRVKLDISGNNFHSRLNSDSIKKTDLTHHDFIIPLILLQKNFAIALQSNGNIVSIQGYNEILQQANTLYKLTPFAEDWVLNKRSHYLNTLLSKMFTDIQGGKATDPNNYSQLSRIAKTNVISVDTAWVNMAISMSSMSNMFKNSKGSGDSAKVFSYLTAHNNIFKNDAYYNRNRLSLIGRVQGRSADLLYDSLLRITPNHFLAGNLPALFNKTHRALQNSADSAYAIIQYYYTDRLFNEWVQFTYAQNFITTAVEDEKQLRNDLKKRGLSEEEITKIIDNNHREKNNAYVLLSKLHNDSRVLMQQKIKPLYLWVTAGKNKANNQVLNTIVAQYEKLDDKYMMEDNGGRYGLLLYKTFTDAGLKNKANAMLKKVIGDLTRYQADTLYKDRYVARNLLAHAYYLSYKETTLTDSIKALEYLSKAALYSPASAREKAYGSFYDRLFLNSKESYADDYVKELFKNGDSDDAGKVFAQYISSALEHLNEAQAMYEKRFPDKSFKAFFADKVVSGWPTAPDFLLKGTDSKIYALADYKGKWLLTDFWGTWCGPCREEMPQVNKFNTTLTEGKLAGWAFLSIACNDNDAAVNKYLTDNNYSIPVAMGDDKIAVNYKIDGYPTKVLISPTGKMISTSFGTDWRGIVAKINELYPAK